MAKTQTAFRIKQNLLDRLQQKADEENRSRNNMLEVLLDKHLPPLKK